ncbi:MAG TPA: sigma-70 family RNA polymerase sigma factor [Planctomycetaceae bacterium]|nr:sigma-70 family RNA polymerase sigma factor [Planctomycetaceae bacterium]
MPGRTWLDELYRQYRRPLFLTAWNVLRCSSLAEDAVHSAFARLAELRTAPRGPKLYVFRAVRNAAIDLCRSRSRRREEPIGEERISESFGPIPDDGELLSSVSVALNQLDEASREVVELHLHSGLTFREIATVLEEPLQTVASRYRRALEKLRQLLEVCGERS